MAENKMKLEIDYDKGRIQFQFENKEIGIMHFKSNRLHNQNYYLDTNFIGIAINNASVIFEELLLKMDKPLQVMLSSAERDKIVLLETAGFQCKRRCYEVEARKDDYIGKVCQGELLYAFEDEEVYEQCCERMMKRYIMTHEQVSPWTGSDAEFFEELPECVAYICTDGKISCFAFVGDEEIAYVYGESAQEFQIFAQVLITEMFKKQETIVFEADDCDDIAMSLKELFINQTEESFNTYIKEK